MSRTGPGDPLVEEPWEQEIGALLGGLPPVDPPAGFIDAALDHRPRHAGRIVAGLGLASIVAVAVVLATGAAGRRAVVPRIDELVARHDLAAQAGLVDRGDEARGDDSPVELPEGFQPAGATSSEEVRQAVYARGDESVSVFVQTGRVAWSSLGPGGLGELAGLPAWVDDDRDIVVLETDDGVITIIGLAPAELERTLRGLTGADRSLPAKARELADAIVVQFGFTPTG
jgi:hypothetical protein